MRKSLVLALGLLSMLLGGVTTGSGPARAEPTGTIISGTNPATGLPVNEPAWWNTGTNGAWNAKAARYNNATNRIAFEANDLSIRGRAYFRWDVPGGTDGTRQSIDPYKEPGETWNLSNYVTVSGPPLAGKTPEADEHTSVVFIANADGTSPVCLGCSDVVPSASVKVVNISPSTNSGMGTVTELTGTAGTIYANQNKDMPVWHPDGKWLFMTIEMKQHGGIHSMGNGEVGTFTDIWAVYADQSDATWFGKLWVRLTDYASTWDHANSAYDFFDNVAMMPYYTAETKCDGGANLQYADYAKQMPYGHFHCSAPGEPPVTSGVMRPVVAPLALANGNVRMAWGRRVGLSIPAQYPNPDCSVINKGLPGGGVQLLGAAEADLREDFNLSGWPTAATYDPPAIVNDKGPWGPTKADKDGVGGAGGTTPTWKGKQYNVGTNDSPLLGHWYEAWDFSYDVATEYLSFASDIMLTQRPGIPSGDKPEDDDPLVAGNWPGSNRDGGTSFPFMDVVQIKVTDPNHATAGLASLTDYNSSTNAENQYDYPRNDTRYLGTLTKHKDWGYWEEPAVYVYDHATGKTWLAFGSAAGVKPSPGLETTPGLYDMLRHNETLGLELWMKDLTAGLAYNNEEITNANNNTATGNSGSCPPAPMVAEAFLYPTDFRTDPSVAANRTIYLTQVPAGAGGGANPSGYVLTMPLSTALAET